MDGIELAASIRHGLADRLLIIIGLFMACGAAIAIDHYWQKVRERK